MMMERKFVIPLIVILPFLVSALMICHSSEAIASGDTKFLGELSLAIIILLGNVVFQIPLLKAIKTSLSCRERAEGKRRR